MILLSALITLPYCAGNHHIERRPIPLEKKPELPNQTPQPQITEPQQDNQPQIQTPPPQIPGVFQTGIASWYGGKFNGRRTANGEIYDMHKLTAAHKELPFNTLVEVENTQNSKKVLVRINDRGPFVKQRIIDLSFKAAQQIGMAETGTAAVHLRIVSAGNADVPVQQPYPDLTPPQNAYVIQAGAYRDRGNAQRILRRIQATQPGIEFFILRDSGLYKIVSKQITSRYEAVKAKQKLDDISIASFIKEKILP